MRKSYQSEAERLIRNLENEIGIVKLAESIITARIENGTDRTPYDIYTMIEKVKALSYMDDASIYNTLVSHMEAV